MGRKTQKKTKTKPGMSMEAFESEFSDLFKTLPPIKRAELTKVFFKLNSKYLRSVLQFIEYLTMAWLSL